MEREELEETVKQLLIEKLEIDRARIKPEANLKEDIGIDNLDFIDLVFIIERRFNFKNNIKEMAKINKFYQLCDYIQRMTTK